MGEKSPPPLAASDGAVEDGGPAAALGRRMGLGSGIALIAGFVIGSGIFATAGHVYNETGSVGLALVLWVVGGLYSALGALSYAELGTMFPTNGADHVYLAEAFHPILGTGYSFTQVVLALPFIEAAMASVFGSYVIKLICYDPSGSSTGADAQPSEWASAVTGAISIVVISAVQMVHKDAAIRVQNVFTVAKLLALAIVAVTGIVWIAKGEVSAFEAPFETAPDAAGNPKPVTALGVGNGLLLGCFSYLGYNSLNTAAGELKHPRRNLPLAVIISILSTCVLYVMANVGYFAVLGSAGVGRSDVVALDLGVAAFGDAGAYLMGTFVAMSAFGAQNGAAFGHSRMIMAAAAEGTTHAWMPAVAGRLSARGTPVAALVLNALLSCLILLAFKGQFAVIGSVVSVVLLTYTGLASAAVIALRRRRPDLPRPFKVPLVVPAVYAAASLAIVALAVASAIADAAAGGDAAPLAVAKIIGYFVGFLSIFLLPIAVHRLSARK